MTTKSSLNPKRRVVIIGGGLAGLSAAEALAQHTDNHLDVTIVEAKRQTGGRAGSFSDPATGDTVDYCQHVAMGCCTNFLQLMQRSDLKKCFRRYRQLRFLHPDHPPSLFAPSRMLPPPLHLARSLGALKYLSRSQKQQIRRGLWRLMRTPSATLRDRTARDWLTQQGQHAATIRDFWDVILISALGEETGVVTMAAARKVFMDGFAAACDAADVYVPAKPLSILFGQQLPDRLRNSGVTISTGDAVKHILEDNDGLTIQLASGSQLSADHIISAAPWHRVAKLLQQTNAAKAIKSLSNWNQIPSSPITGIHLWFDREITSLPHAVLVGTTSQWMFRDPIDSSRETTGCYYQVVISASHQARQIPRDDLVDHVLAELRHAFPDARDARLLRHRVVTDPNSVFSVRPEVEILRPTARTPLPWFHLAGDWIDTGWPATMEGAVISGRMAATSLLEQEGLPPVQIDRGLRPSWLARLLIKA